MISWQSRLSTTYFLTKKTDGFLLNSFLLLLYFFVVDSLVDLFSMKDAGVIHPELVCLLMLEPDPPLLSVCRSLTMWRYFSVTRTNAIDTGTAGRSRNRRRPKKIILLPIWRGGCAIHPRGDHLDHRRMEKRGGLLVVVTLSTCRNVSSPHFGGLFIYLVGERWWWGGESSLARREKGSKSRTCQPPIPKSSKTDAAFPCQFQ